MNKDKTKDNKKDKGGSQVKNSNDNKGLLLTLLSDQILVFFSYRRCSEE